MDLRLMFRIWDKTEYRMVYRDLGAYCNCDQGKQICYEDSVLMQCTGMVDQKGRKIYEGDIVKFTHSSEPEYNLDAAVVEWIAEWCRFCIGGNASLNYRMNLIVLGNIYENPEILNGQTNLNNE